MLLKKQQQGFTLIEIMITVAIVAILASIAYPSYVDSVRKGKRSDAKVELLRIAQMQEGYFAQNLSYASSLTQLGLSDNTVASEQNEYNISIGESLPAGCTGTNATPCTSFRLDAFPSGSQASDTACPKFTLSSSGQKGTNGNQTAEQIRRCWK